MVNKYEKILIAEDIIIDLSASKCENDNHFPELKEKFNLTNLIKSLTCFLRIREGPW